MDLQRVLFMYLSYSAALCVYLILEGLREPL